MLIFFFKFSASVYVAGKIGSQVKSVFTQVKLVILILSRLLNIHLDELKKLFWSLN